jgi:hypothetical protein
LERVRTSDAFRLLTTDAAAMFLTDASGRLLRQNDPERSAAPLMYFAGCEAGNLCFLRSDVSPPVAQQISALVAREPPYAELGAHPLFIERYRELLALDGPIGMPAFAQIHHLPRGLSFEHHTTVVKQGSAEGDKLFAELKRYGLPASLRAMGFADVSHFWEPWCVALQRGDIAAIAFAARLGANAAEIGVATLPAFRGRKLAAAVTAGWSSLPQLGTRELFYSTTRDNIASQHVIARLGLPLVGISVRLG